MVSCDTYIITIYKYNFISILWLLLVQRDDLDLKQLTTNFYLALYIVLRNILYTVCFSEINLIFYSIETIRAKTKSSKNNDKNNNILPTNQPFILTTLT